MMVMTVNNSEDFDDHDGDNDGNYDVGDYHNADSDNYIDYNDNCDENIYYGVDDEFHVIDDK